MEHLDDIPLDELQEALDTVEGAEPATRLIAAIAYKNGVTQTELAAWFAVERKTIYNWLTRFESAASERAVKNSRRPGRKRKVTESQYHRFVAAMQEFPARYGYDEPTWTPALAQQYLADEFDVAYSIPSCRRLMKEAGLRYRRPQRPVADASGTETESCDDERTAGERRWLPE